MIIGLAGFRGCDAWNRWRIPAAGLIGYGQSRHNDADPDFLGDTEEEVNQP